MMAIIAGHFVHQTDILSIETGGNLFFSYVFGSGHRIGVNLFLLIGTWFLVESNFKPERILRLYGQMAFYTISITLIILAVGIPHSTVDVIRCMMPFSLRPVWFGSAYIALLLLIPFLNATIRVGGKRVVVILFVLMSVFSTITPTLWDNFICALAWFSFIYLAMYVIKPYIQKASLNKWLVLGMGLLLYLVLAYFEYKGLYIAIQYIDDYKSIPNLIISLCLFYFFTRIDIGANNVINWLAASVFAVYIVHQTPSFKDYLWESIYHTSSWIGTDHFIINAIGVVLITFFSITLIDRMRIRWVESMWINSRIYKWLDATITKFYKDVL